MAQAHGVEHTAEGIEIGLDRGRLPLVQLGGHEEERPCAHRGGVREPPRQTEIDDLDLLDPTPGTVWASGLWATIISPATSAISLLRAWKTTPMPPHPIMPLTSYLPIRLRTSLGAPGPGSSRKLNRSAGRMNPGVVGPAIGSA